MQADLLAQAMSFIPDNTTELRFHLGEIPYAGVERAALKNAENAKIFILGIARLKNLINLQLHLEGLGYTGTMKDAAYFDPNNYSEKSSIGTAKPYGPYDGILNSSNIGLPIAIGYFVAMMRKVVHNNPTLS